MFADIQKKCTKCGGSFWLMANEQRICRDQNRRVPDRCPLCHPTNASGEISTALATLERARDQGLGDLLPDPASLFGDILQLMEDASAPIEVCRRTFSEWLRGLDLQAAQIEKKLRAGNAADQLLRQRLELTRRLQEVARLRYDAVEAGMAQQQKLLRARIEQLELEEKIAQLEALKEQRVETMRLEETRKHVHLLNEINPPANTRPATSVDLVKQAIDDHRKQFKAKATAKQLVISDFLKELQKSFRANVEDAVKSARIRAVLEAYKQDVEALPKDIRNFLEDVEDEEVVESE